MSYRGLGLALAGLVFVLAACAPAAATVAPTSTPAPAAASSPVTGAQAGGSARVSGSVKSVAGNKVTLADGTVIATTPQTRVSRLEQITPADLKTGQYVAVTAKRQTDNTLLASVVNVFDESLRGAGSGQRPMTGGNLMTNATIDQVSGDTFTVTWDGGGARVRLAPDAKVGKIVIGSIADVKVGSTISAAVANGVAQSVSLQ